MAESAGLLFKIKGDESDAVRALNHTQRETDTLTGSTAGLTSAFSSLAGPAAIAAAGVVAIGVAALAGARALFDLTKTTADFGAAIFDASEKTGLSAERLSAMKFAADQSGASLEQIESATAKFAKTIGDASNGSKEAAARLERLGVTSTDMDTALKQALATIVKVTPGTQQMALAMDAFGKSGAELLPFIKSFDGDLDALTEQAKELGVTITDEAAAASDQFGDTLDTLNAQLDGVTRTIGIALMPVMQELATSLSNFITENQSAIQNFGQGVGDTINGLIITMQRFDKETQQTTGSSVAAWTAWSIKTLAAIDPVQRTLITLINYLKQVGQADREASTFGAAGGRRAFTPPSAIVAPPGGGGRGGGGVDKEAQKAAALEARDIQAQVTIEANNFKRLQEEMVANYEEMRKKLGTSGILGFTEATNEATKRWTASLTDSILKLEQLETQALKRDATENERALLRQKQDERRHDLETKHNAELEKQRKALKDQEDKDWQERLERGERDGEAAQQRFEADFERMRLLEEAFQATIGITSPSPTLAPEDNRGPFAVFTDSWLEFFNTIEQTAPTLADTMTGIAEIMQNAFQQVAQALGNVVQQWVLYGNTGPAVMRKILAAALASIAAEAAVRAIYELAMGFASLAVQDYEGAAMHFGSAALFGSIATVAAIAGRAVAGNAFQQQTGQATGQTGANAQGSRNSEAGAYSGLGTQTIENGINSPSLRGELRIKLELDEDGVLQVAQRSVQSNGGWRNLIIETANP